MNDAANAHAAWLAQVHEEALEPDLEICDAHHHLWLDEGHTGWPYTLEDLHRDTGSGHNVVRTVFLECGAQYRAEGPAAFRPVGETEFVAAAAQASVASGGAEIAAIVSSADLLGDDLDAVLDAHDAAGQGRFRGIRYVTAQDDYKPLATTTPPGVMQNERYLAGVRHLGARGLTYDAMCYFHQIPEFVNVARGCPDVTIVANHLLGPVGVGPYKDRRREVLAQWRDSMAEVASCPNVSLKLGGIGMPMYMRWDRQAVPPTSAELAAAWQDEIRFCIDNFGPDRCLFESNFPVDKRGCSYVVLWNAFKRIATAYSASEKRDLFHNSAARAYRLPPVS
jgi:predicted TIM-barrel fold metal-dependent hydrolase